MTTTSASVARFGTRDLLGRRLGLSAISAWRELLARFPLSGNVRLLMTGVQSVERAIALLGAAAEQPSGLVGLATAADLPTTTAARLLATLEAVSALSRDDDGIYRIGPAISALATAGDPGASLQAVAHPHMLELVGELDEAIGLSVPVEDELVTIDQVDAPRPVQAEDWTGTRWPLDGGASGAVLLATWPHDQVEQVLARTPERQREAFRDRVEQARATGLAWSHGDYVPELSSVAAAVPGEDGRAVALLYAYGPSYRFPDPDRVEAVEQALLDRAGRISRAWLWPTAEPG
jgi:DNA-binding IclR family transcriptional regulator